MRIEHQPPIAAIGQKVNAVLHLETPSGEVVTISHWSLAGLKWPEDAPQCPKTGTLTVPFQGVDVGFPVRLESSDVAGEVLLKGLSGRQRETLALFYRALLSGKMASSSDVITSLDTPVDLVPMEETASEAAKTKLIGKFRFVRVVVNVLTYIALAAFVVGVIGDNILTNLDRIDIQHGRVLAPVSDLPVLRGGYVQKILVSPGDAVAAGVVLATVSDPVYQAELQKAEADWQAAQMTLQALNRAQSELTALADETDLLLRLAGVARIYHDFAKVDEFDDIRRRWINLRDRDPAAAARFDPLRITQRLLSSAIQSSELEVTKRMSDVQARRGLVEATHIVSQHAGTVQEILVREGQYLAKGEVAVTVERREARLTMGWVSERFAETVFIGMPATIGCNEGGEKVSINGTVVDVTAGDHPERPGEFGIIVTIQPLGLAPGEVRARLRSGAPVNLEAAREIYSRATAWVKSWLPADV